MHVPEDSSVGGVAFEVLERRRDRVETRDAVERDLRHGVRQDRLRALQQSRALLAIDGPVGGVEQRGQRIVLEVVDVASGRGRAIGGEERGELGVGRHLPPVQHRVEAPLEPDAR